jgi:hypothetical protein
MPMYLLLIAFLIDCQFVLIEFHEAGACYDIMVLREPYSFSAWHSVYKADYSLNAI